MDGLFLIDTMHLNVKYPYLDVYKNWVRHTNGLDHRKLKEGVPAGDFVVRSGASCYKVSVWQHDARVYLTDYVDERVGEGKGSGIWIQLGPKFILHHMNHLHTAVKDLSAAIGVVGDFPIKITRLDFAGDMLGIEMKSQDLELWRDGWVGRSKVSGNFFNSRTGALETINIGSRGSAVFLRVYDKVAQAVKEGDIDYWRDVWKGFDGPVTRVEWEVKTSEGNFSKDLVDFNLFNGFSLCELLNYLLDWGRLCIPNPEDSNNRRWEDAPFWADLREMATVWTNDVDWPTSRLGKEFHGITSAYVKFISGTIAGAMARFGEDEPSIMKMFDELGKHGEPLDKIKDKAEHKAAIFSKL